MKSNRLAFSLIEVLVAMVIVSLITTTGMFAFKMSLNQIDRQSSLTFEEAMHFTQLKNLINGTYFYIIEEKDPYNITQFDYKYLFQKDEHEITFVSDAPIYGKKLSLINLKINNNTLIYKETPIYSKESDYKHPLFSKKTTKHILFKNINNAKFTYEEPIDLPQDKYFTTKIQKLIKLEFEKNNEHMTYIFDIKYNFYKLKVFLKSKRAVE